MVRCLETVQPRFLHRFADSETGTMLPSNPGFSPRLCVSASLRLFEPPALGSKRHWSWRFAYGLAQSFLNEEVNQIRHANRVAPLVVIPRNHLRQVAADGERVEGAEDG